MALGDTVLDVDMRIERCVMATRPQAGGVERDLNVLRTINHERAGCLAVGALVARPGRPRRRHVRTAGRVEPMSTATL